MAIKLKNRVTVLPLPENHPLKHREGMVGEVDGLKDKDGKSVEKLEGKDGLVLVDSQLVGGERKGHLTMRDWFKPEELEVG